MLNPYLQCQVQSGKSAGSSLPIRTFHKKGKVYLLSALWICQKKCVKPSQADLGLNMWHRPTVTHSNIMHKFAGRLSGGLFKSGIQILLLDNDSGKTSSKDTLMGGGLPEGAPFSTLRLPVPPVACDDSFSTVCPSIRRWSCFRIWDRWVGVLDLFVFRIISFGNIGVSLIVLP